jgi:predicted XRE-type DNA-binding protein
MRNGRKISAHRIAYFLHYQHDPGGLFVCHHCDNRWCVNPYHLFLGTNRTNSLDRHSKGRENPAKGERHYKTRFTAEIITEIRSLYKSGMTQIEIAERFEITQSHVKDILIGRNWGHVPFDWGEAYELNKKENLRAANLGSKNPASKLTPKIVQEIRLLSETGLKQQSIADRFSISQTHVSQIVRRVRWDHLP